ncbi:MAG: hypothetical protein K2H19_00830 [Ruminococcus sp.]|nr:hypothetical protein [Ruminococcus sp.]
MITPFEYEWAFENIEEIAESSDDAVWLINFSFESVWHECENDFIVLDTGYEVWTSACLCDAVMNNTDYSKYCSGYEKIYIKAVEILKQDLFRKKFLTKKPIHNISEILQSAIDALDYVLGIVNESELADEMQNRGIFEEWRGEIIDLQNRLSKHIEYI